MSPADVALPIGLRRGRVIAILRHHPFADAMQRIDALAAAGLTCVEITLDSPDAARVITAARERHPKLAVGAGTVLDPAALRRAAAAGAAFVLSPHVDVDLITLSTSLRVPFIAGAFSATEALTAARAGAAAVKLFPAMPAGPPYLAALRQPLPGIPFVPTGGVTPDNVGAFFETGAAAVALGSALTALEGAALGAAAAAVVAAAQAAPEWSW